MKRIKWFIGSAFLIVVCMFCIPIRAEKGVLEAEEYININSNDVTNEMNSFLSFCKTKNKNAHFSSGVYKVNGTITLRNGVSIFGEPGVVIQGTDPEYQSYLRDNQEAVSSIDIQNIVFDNVTLYLQHANTTNVQISHNAFINAKKVNLDIASGLKPDNQNKNGGESTGYYISKNYNTVHITSNVFFRDKNSLGRGIGLYKTKDSVIKDNYFGLLEDIEQSKVSQETKSLLHEIKSLKLLNEDSNQGYFMTGINILNSDIHTKIIGNHFSFNTDITEVQYENQSQATDGYNRDHILYAKMFDGLEIVGNYFKGMNKNQDGAVKCRNGENLIIYRNVFEDSLILLYVQNAQTNLFLKNVLIQENIFLNKAYTSELLQLPYQKPDGTTSSLSKYLTIDYLILFKNYNANSVVDHISIISNQVYSCGLPNEQIRIDNTNFKMPSNLTIQNNKNINQKPLRLTIRNTLNQTNYDSNQGQDPNYKNGNEYQVDVEEYQTIDLMNLASCKEVEYQIDENQIYSSSNQIYMNKEKYEGETLESGEVYELFILSPTKVTVLVEGQPYEISSNLYTLCQVKIENQYQITFDTNGHGIEPSVQKNLTEIPSILPVLFDEGYRFEGWYLDTSCTQKAIEGQVLTQNITLYAKWMEETYTIYFDVQGHGLKQNRISDVKAIPDSLPELREEGYIFEGWYLDASCTKKVVLGSTITKDTILYAKWQENIKYTVIFQIVDDQVLTKLQVYNGQMVACPNVPSKEEYEFDGWYLEAKCITRWEFDENPIDKDLILYGKWVKTLFTITFQTNGIGSYPSITGTQIPDSLPVLESTGYRFIGWYYDSNFSQPATAGNKISSDITLYAKWEKIVYYHVKYQILNGETLAMISVEENKKIREPAPPTKEGYEFAGWYKDEECTESWDFNQPVTENLTLYGKWYKNKKNNTTLLLGISLTGVILCIVISGIGFFLIKKKK